MLPVAIFMVLLPIVQDTEFGSEQRLRVLIETDAGGDPDDEQSLVRFLLYMNEWDVEGIIVNRVQTRDGENLNPERTGLGVVRRLVRAYESCFPKLVLHDPRYPKPEVIMQRTVGGDPTTDDGVNLIIETVDRPDPRPLWYCDWGSDRDAPVSMKRALDRVLRERGPKGYAQFKDKLRLVSYDQFGDHTTRIEPSFKLWVNTFQPPLEGKRWYHRFSSITAKAGGFDLERDVRTNHGPLGSMYPTNTTHVQKEGDTMTFLYLVPTGMNDPAQPTWGSWGGRYGLSEEFRSHPYYWANQADQWNGVTHRDNTVARWAVHLQNDFKARMDWCVTDSSGANHPPRTRVSGAMVRFAVTGEEITLDAGESSDPDRNTLSFDWFFYPEAGGYKGTYPMLRGANQSRASFIAPRVDDSQTIHVVLALTDNGEPALTRYQRVIVTLKPSE